MAYDLLLERFLRYAKINTRSDENATRTPTTQSQVDFALNILKPELEELGLSNIHYLESNGYLVDVYKRQSLERTNLVLFLFCQENQKKQISTYISKSWLKAQNQS